MTWSRTTLALAAVLLASAADPSNVAGAQQPSFETRKPLHACAQLVRPELNQAQRQARKIGAKDIQAGMLDITRQLARDAAFQEALDCLRRSQRTD